MFSSSEILGSKRGKDLLASIRYVQHLTTDDLCDDETPVVKVKDYKATMESHIKALYQLTSTRGLSFERGNTPMGRQSMTGMVTPNIQGVPIKT